MPLYSQYRHATLLSLCGLGLMSGFVHGDNTPPVAASPKVDAQQTAYRTSIAEESVSKEAEKIRSDMSQLIKELQLNGLSGGNLDLLSNARAICRA